DPHFSRSLRVYDSLGQGQDITMKFFHTTSPTATAAGVTNVSGVTNLMDEFSTIASTATLTSTVNIVPDLGTIAPGLSLGDTFIINLNGEASTISLDPSWTATDLVNAINAAFTGSPASVVGSTVELTANTPIEIRFGGSQPITEAKI